MYAIQNSAGRGGFMAIGPDGVINQFHAPLEEATLFASFQAVVEALVRHGLARGVYPMDGYNLVTIMKTITRTVGAVIA